MLSKTLLLYTLATVSTNACLSVFILFCSTRRILYLFFKHQTATSSTTLFTWCQTRIILKVTRCYWISLHVLIFTIRYILEAATKWMCWGSSSSQPLWVRLFDTSAYMESRLEKLTYLHLFRAPAWQNGWARCTFSQRLQVHQWVCHADHQCSGVVREARKCVFVNRITIYV